MKKMDYTIGFQAGRAGPKWTATALTDRAKVRTLGEGIGDSLIRVIFLHFRRVSHAVQAVPVLPRHALENTQRIARLSFVNFSHQRNFIRAVQHDADRAP